MKTTQPDFMSFRRDVSDVEYAELADRVPSWNRKGLCPTCGDEETYLYKGEKHECDCRVQKMLERYYLLANIGRTYHTLGFEDLYDAKAELKEVLLDYIDKWEINRRYGRGITFYGPLGTGKTFAQVLLLKEIIKLGETAWFQSFPMAVSDYVVSEQRKLLVSKVRSAAIFSLDELTSPVSSKQRDLYEEVAEQIIRYRVENAMPTVIGTNLTMEEVSENYPRLTSLLALTQLWVQIPGRDVRYFDAQDEMTRLVEAGEVRPIK